MRRATFIFCYNALSNCCVKLFFSYSKKASRLLTSKLNETMELRWKVMILLMPTTWTSNLKKPAMCTVTKSSTRTVTTSSHISTIDAMRVTKKTTVMKTYFLLCLQGGRFNWTKWKTTTTAMMRNPIRTAPGMLATPNPT